MTDLSSVPTRLRPGGLPLPLPPPMSPAEERAATEAFRRAMEDAGGRLSAVGGQIVEGRVGDALRDLLVPGFISGHQWPDTILPETVPRPGPDGLAVGRMSEVPSIGYELDVGRGQVSVFGRDEFGQATTPALRLQADTQGVLRGSDGVAVGLLHTDGSFELQRQDLLALADVVERDSPYYSGGGRTRQATSAEAMSTPPNPDWEPEETPRTNPTAADELKNAMRGYRTSEYQVGRWTVRLDAGSTGDKGTGMRHIMERHVPETWNGSVKGTQTFFARGTTPSDIQRMVDEVIRQNRDFLSENIAKSSTSVLGRTAEGANVRVVIVRGRVMTAFPEP